MNATGRELGERKGTYPGLLRLVAPLHPLAGFVSIDIRARRRQSRDGLRAKSGGESEVSLRQSETSTIYGSLEMVTACDA